jgi:hypothetical protein
MTGLGTRSMSKPRPIYRTDGEWMATLHDGHLYDTQGEWVGWSDGDDVYRLDGEYVGYISRDGRLLRLRVLPYRKRRTPPAPPPRLPPPGAVPLPPMFAELSYDTIDVFEEVPNVFAVVSDVFPDAGEAPLRRLVDVNPQLAAQQKLHAIGQELLEEMAYGIVYSYRATHPPVPIEAMAAGRLPSSAHEVVTASPHERLRLAGQLIERLGHARWAAERGYCGPEGFTPAQVEYAARALLLPRQWVLQVPEASRQPGDLAQRYCVPEETALLRLHDLK